MSWPEPNKRGVYNKEDAEVFRYEDKYLYVEGHILQIDSDTWLAVASYDLKYIPVNSGTMGCRSPLKRSSLKCDPSSRAEAIEVMNHKIMDYVKTGLSERHSKASVNSWHSVDAWCFNIDRQLALFG